MENVLKVLFFVVAFVVLLVFAFKLYLLKRAKALKGMDVDILKDGVLYFYSQKCGACKIMEPSINLVSKRLQVKRFGVFSEGGQKVAKSFRIMATPTTVVVKNGKVHKVFVGIVDASKILREFKP